MGTALVTTVTRVRGQIASNLIGQHVQVGDVHVMQRLQTYAAVAGRDDPGAATARAVGILGSTVRTASQLQGIIDSFVVVGGMTALALLLVVMHKPAPLGPASYRPLFGRRDEEPAQ
jgi:hypothetical protein